MPIANPALDNPKPRHPAAVDNSAPCRDAVHQRDLAHFARDNWQRAPVQRAVPTLSARVGAWFFDDADHNWQSRQLAPAGAVVSEIIRAKVFAHV